MISFVNKKGVALVLVLVVILICAGFLAAIMYYSTTGTEVSGLQRKYQSSKDASLGSIDIMTKDIIPRVLGGTALSSVRSSFLGATDIVSSIQIGTGITDSCFSLKLETNTAGWTCSDNNPDLSEAGNVPDISFDLKGMTSSSRPYHVDVKIIDTHVGNSGKGGLTGGGGTPIGLAAGGVVDVLGSGGGGGVVSVKHDPYLYTIVTEAKTQGSSAERVNFQVLYAY